MPPMWKPSALKSVVQLKGVSTRKRWVPRRFSSQ